jgi:predicted kinase
VAPIDIPVPALVVLVGAAGAGKSTLAARLFDPSDVVSSDALRASLGGDPADPRTTRTAFGILPREVARRLSAGHLVVVDATNVDRAARIQLVRLARVAGAPAVAIALALAPDEVHRRNAARPGRIVPRDVVDRHLDRLARTDPADLAATMLAEGFAAAYVARTPDDVAGLGPVRPAGRPVSPP